MFNNSIKKTWPPLNKLIFTSLCPPITLFFRAFWQKRRGPHQKVVHGLGGPNQVHRDLQDVRRQDVQGGQRPQLCPRGSVQTGRKGVFLLLLTDLHQSSRYKMDIFKFFHEFYVIIGTSLH